MNDEMHILERNNTWELVPLPKNKQTVNSKWIYSINVNADESVERYKTRLVAKRYTQVYQIDYHEIFSPVAKMNTIKIILSLTVIFS
ncbi:unnamed protein product [Spirodela intermedia]|uniref:Reverse transcriptase Ty1/copia-type domain-containing protein n=1 Tax=Spirodela intermedia TaxID=51605 RepID=A0A7I8LD83_SPIIN|nr:unnamed protein product [Spirodela intermedia]